MRIDSARRSPPARRCVWPCSSVRPRGERCVRTATWTVAVLYQDERLAGAQDLALQSALTLAARREVDLVGLERATTLLCWHVARSGVPIFQASPVEFSRFRARAASEYIEFAPAFHACGELFRRRIAESGSPMTDVGLVLAKLTILREHVDRMARRRPGTLDAFRTDINLQHGLALSLLVALQEAADIALHIASDEGWGVASSYAESFELLARRGVVEPALARRMADMASLRNRIAHGYGSVDFELLWRETPDGIVALGDYAAAVAAFLGR